MFHRALLVVVALLPAAVAHAQSPVRYINPPGLSKPTGYTHVVVAATLARPELLVEIEAVVVLPSPPARR